MYDFLSTPVIRSLYHKKTSFTIKDTSQDPYKKVIVCNVDESVFVLIVSFTGFAHGPFESDNTTNPLQSIICPDGLKITI
jgi:hypothetical protein